MFEHFGLKDIFYAFKRHIRIIIFILIATIILGCLMGIKQIKNARNLNAQQEKGFYLATASYNVKPNIEITTDNVSVYQNLPEKVAEILNTDFCQQDIFNKLIEKYSKTDIIKNTVMSESGVKEEDLNMYCLKNLFFSQQYEKTSVMQLYVETYNQDMSSYILGLYMDYVENELVNNIDNISITYIDSVYDDMANQSSAIKILLSDDENKTIDTVNVTRVINVKKVMLKSVAVPFILVAFIICLVIFIAEFFNPKMNRKADFSEYNIPIIGEIYIDSHKRGNTNV